MFAKALDHRVLLRLGARLHHRADDLQVPVEDVLQLHVDLAAATKNADLHQAATVGQLGDVAREVGRANEVDYHVDAAPLGFVGDDCGEILVFVVDGHVGAQVFNT